MCGAFRFVALFDIGVAGDFGWFLWACLNAPYAPRHAIRPLRFPPNGASPAAGGNNRAAARALKGPGRGGSQC